MFYKFPYLIRLKKYYGHEKEFKALNALNKAMEEYIQWYNLERINVKRKELSPFEYRQQSLLQL